MSAAAPVRVVVAEDNDVFRDTLQLLLGLEDGIAVVGMAGDGEAVVELCVRLQPDVVLMDYRLPVLDGVEATAEVCRRAPGTAVVALTAEATNRERDALVAAARALAAGGAGGHPGLRRARLPVPAARRAGP